jgi:hypothetical protein
MGNTPKSSLQPAENSLIGFLGKTSDNLLKLRSNLIGVQEKFPVIGENSLQNGPYQGIPPQRVSRRTVRTAIFYLKSII